MNIEEYRLYCPSKNGVTNSIYFLLFCLVFTACQNNIKENNNPVVQIDPVASLFSKTTIAAEKEYRKVDDISLRLDVYVPSKRLGEPPWVKHTKGRKPTLLYFHGGGWRGGEKESRSLEVLPYVEKGWVVVTANYRHLNQTSLPEIIGDCRTALNWVYDHAGKYKIDTSKIVCAGNSAGGHLALMTALAKEGSIYGTTFPPSKRNLKVAAVVNWYGITDVSIFVANWKDKHILVEDSMRLNRMYNITSPLNFIDETSPPILTIHGAIDKIVPFDHAKILHEKLEAKGLKNKLLKIENRKHGDFDAAEMTHTYNEIWQFMEEIGIEKQSANQ